MDKWRLLRFMIIRVMSIKNWPLVLSSKSEKAKFDLELPTKGY